MATTLSMTGTVQRADGVSVVDQLSLAPTRSVSEDLSYTVVMGTSSSHVVAFGPIAAASFVAIYATGQITAVLTNSLASSQPLKGDHFLLSNTDLTGITLNNPSGTATVTVRIIFGGA